MVVPFIDWRNSGSPPVIIFAAYKLHDMNYKDLVFRRIESTSAGDVLQAVVRFDNGLGLSVLSGPGTLTSSDRPYEVAVISFAEDGSYSIVYPDFTHNDVLSFLTGDQVSEYMVMVSAEAHVTGLDA